MNTESEQVVLQNRHAPSTSRNVAGKASLSRTVSEPQRKQSYPDTFIFPDVKQKSVPRKSSTLQSRSLSIDAGEEDCAVSTSDVQTIGAGHSVNVFQNLPGTQQWNDGTSRSMTGYSHRELDVIAAPGVSEQYFNNVINELLKTKRYLHDLESNKSGRADSADQSGEIRRQVGELRLQNDQLKMELAAKEAILQEKQQAVLDGTQGDGSQYDSLELVSTEDMLRSIDTATQTDPSDSFMQHKTPASDQDHTELVKENERLKTSLNLFTILLQEEKAHSKQKSEQLAQRTRELNLSNSEKNKLCEQLGHLRTQFEELQSERNALQKEKQLSVTEQTTPSFASGSQYSSAHSRTQSGLSRNQFHSGSSERLNFQRGNRSGSSERLQRSMSGSAESFVLPSQFDYGIRSGDEMNIPNVSGSNIATETRSHEVFSCPTCLQEFQVEGTYLAHLAKCIE